MSTSTRTARARRILPRVLPAVTWALLAPVVVACAMTTTEQPEPATPAPVERPGVTLPTLDRDRYPDCQTPGPGRDVPATVVVVDQGAEVTRVTFDGAWATNTNAERADDVWVIGVCP